MWMSSEVATSVGRTLDWRRRGKGRDEARPTKVASNVVVSSSFGLGRVGPRSARNKRGLAGSHFLALSLSISSSLLGYKIFLSSSKGKKVFATKKGPWIIRLEIENKVA